jgi:hypothetical protein
MANQFDQLDDRLTAFIEDQHVFFVGTAARDGRVNVSPKGLDSLRVVSPTRVVWLNGTGSGNESAAHVRDVDRMTIMFCSFDAQPLILRLYGTVTVLHDVDPGWDDLIQLFPNVPGARNLFVVELDLVQTSCGWGVPLLDFVEDRSTYGTWAERKGPDGLAEYQQEKNRVSIDGFDTGLPARG